MAGHTAFAGTPGVPLFVSGLIALGLLGAGTWLPLPGGEETPGMLMRLLSNGMCRIILAIAIGAVVYALLELQGARMDARGHVGTAGWLWGRSGEILTANQWQAQHERRLAPISFVIFALPLLGFIGTVLGISGAIGELGGLFDGADRNAALALVLSELRFAFDTTFAGLMGVLPVSLAGLMARSVSAGVEASLGPEAPTTASL